VRHSHQQACPPQEGLSEGRSRRRRPGNMRMFFVRFAGRDAGPSVSDFCSRNRKIVAEIVRFWSGLSVFSSKRSRDRLQPSTLAPPGKKLRKGWPQKSTRITKISRRANLRMPCPPQEGADFCSRNRKIVAQIVRFWQIERLLIQTLTRSATALIRSNLVQRPAGNVRECAP
jgi:hypothetical protein